MVYPMNETYRSIIDELVAMCKTGQGNIAKKRTIAGLWNASARPDFLADQHEMNVLLGKLSMKDREVLALMLSNEVEVGVFETLKVLEKHGIAPFTDGYEGSPHEDFVGRMGEWEWPISESRK